LQAVAKTRDFVDGALLLRALPVLFIFPRRLFVSLQRRNTDCAPTVSADRRSR